MDKILQELEAQKTKLEKEYQEAMSKYRSELLRLEHEIVERSKEVSRQGGASDTPEEGWNVEHEGLVKNDKDEGEHLFEREYVYDAGKP